MKILTQKILVLIGQLTLHYIPEMVIKMVAGIKGKIMSYFKTNTKVIVNLNLSIMCIQIKRSLKTNNKNKLEHKMTKAIKGRIITDIKNLFEQEENYYKPVRVGNFYCSN